MRVKGETLSFKPSVRLLAFSALAQNTISTKENRRWTPRWQAW